MKRFLAIPLAFWMLSACKPESDALPERYQAAEETSSAENTIPKAHRLDIGDVEAAVSIEATVADRSRGALVEVNDVITLKKTLTMCVATIRPPYPPQLWLKVQIKVPRGKGFGKCPVAVRGAVLRDDTPIQDFGAVVAEEVIITEPESGARLSPDTFEVNALAGLEAPPETMLIHARAEALLMPEGTDVASVDPETVRVDPGDTTTLLSNPVRINFAPEAAAQ